MFLNLIVASRVQQQLSLGNPIAAWEAKLQLQPALHRSFVLRALYDLLPRPLTRRFACRVLRSIEKRRRVERGGGGAGEVASSDNAEFIVVVVVLHDVEEEGELALGSTLRGASSLISAA